MSGLAAVFSSAGTVADPRLADRLLAALRPRGADRQGSWRDTRALLAVSRHAWEMQDGFSGDVLVLSEHGCVIAADATLYYTEDLVRALQEHGVEPRGSTPSHLILAAYQAWGDECVPHLEGDFAFVLWDPDRGRALGARDFSGKRPLFFAECGESIVVTSSLSAALAHPACSRELDVVAIAENAAGAFAEGRSTCYRAISTIPAGWSVTWRPGSPPRTRREWQPPHPGHSDVGFEDAARELRVVLGRSVAERLAPAGPTSVWLSGGWDSTAVFGAGASQLAARVARSHLRPVSVSYPSGDPGREDELIESVARHWQADIHWLQIDRIPLFADPLNAAATRNEPFAHVFENWNRALACGSRAVGANVALEGVGGDQLFQVSDVYLADLLRSGRWITLVREWRSGSVRDAGLRGFLRWAIVPSLPAVARRATSLLTGGRPLLGPLEDRLPPWIDSSFVRRHEIAERQRRDVPQRRVGSHADHEMLWYLLHPYFPKVFACVSGLALEHGVEIRSPLYDQRVIALAASRPRAERSSGGETKRLLRHAMRGALPNDVLAPRVTRTGTTAAYFERSMRQALPALAAEAFRAPLLADMGIIDPAVLRRAVTAYAQSGWGGAQVGVNLFFTLQTELWLRAHEGAALAQEHLPEGNAARSRASEHTAEPRIAARAASGGR